LTLLFQVGIADLKLKILSGQVLWSGVLPYIYVGVGLDLNVLSKTKSLTKLPRSEV